MSGAVHRLKTIFARSKLHFPRTAYAVRYVVPSQVRRRRRWAGRSIERIFSTIYDENYWNSEQSHSGGGSTLEATVNIRQELPRILTELGARSILDAPCGDFHWMQTVPLDVDLYIGGDIVAALVEKLQTAYNGARRRFIRIDLTSDPLPDVEVFFCRDCLQHLAPNAALKVLDNFRRSRCLFLVATSFVTVKYNTNGFTGGTNTLNLCLPPFNLPEPMMWIEDHGTDDNVFERCMGVWPRYQVVMI